MAEPRFALDLLANHLRDTFGPLIDMSDWSTHSAPDRDDAFCSRALAALCIQYLAKTDITTAAMSVVDDGEDNGIDAIHYDPASCIAYAVASKWKKDSGAGLGSQESMRFANGLRDLQAQKFENFGRLRAREKELRRVLLDPATRWVAVIVHTGSQKLSGAAAMPLDDWIADVNSDVKFVELKQWVFTDVFEILTADAKPKPIDLDLYLYHFGRLKSPSTAFYGRVPATTIAHWWQKHGRALCAKNLRHFRNSTDVNDAIGDTLKNDPKRFWYLNNGLTIVCDSIEPAMGGNHTIVALKCRGVSIVNGAQTYGMIGQMMDPVPQDPDTDGEANGDTAWVQVRLIMTGADDKEFGDSITYATNFQNAVVYRDLAALDPHQHRLAVEFAIEGRVYAFKSGDEEVSGHIGCGLSEATVALACSAGSVDIAVQAKREIGKLWANIKGAPYTELFNKHTNAARVWNAVQIMRGVEERLHVLSRASMAPRADLVAGHLNRLILHMVYQDPRLQEFANHKADAFRLKRIAEADCDAVFGAVAEYLDKHHRLDYLASLSKNLTKCAAVAKGAKWDPPEVPDIIVLPQDSPMRASKRDRNLFEAHHD